MINGEDIMKIASKFRKMLLVASLPFSLVVMMVLPAQSVLAGTEPVSHETIAELEQRIAELEQMLDAVKSQQENAQKQQADAEDRIISQVEQVQEEIAMKKEESSGISISPSGSKLNFYGSIRPSLTYFSSEVNNPHGFEYEPTTSSSSTEVTDFFTRIGIKGETDIGAGMTAFVRGEMEVAIDQNGEFDPRLAFAGVKGDFGRVAIGRQWHPHYNTIVEVTDLYNHRSSPFGYDREGPFRRPNLVTYSNSISSDFGTFKIDVGGQFGRDNPGLSNDDRPGLDSGSVGVSYKTDKFYIGASYLQRQRSVGSRDFLGVGASVNLTDNLYVAATVQHIEQTIPARAAATVMVDDGAGGTVNVDIPARGEHEQDGHSVDIVGAYNFGDGIKLIAGYFDVDASHRGLGNLVVDPTAAGNFGGFDGNDHGYTHGYNLTLQKQVSDNFRIFAEWLRFEYDNAVAGNPAAGRVDEDSVDSLSVGVRYDFDVSVF